MTNAKQQLITKARALVIRTRDWPFLSGIYRLIYQLGLRLFAAALWQAFRGRATLYLRRGMAGTDWVPGVSDIDLLIVLDTDAQSRPQITRKLWQLYRAFKRVLPFLGEIQIGTRSELGTYTHSGGWRAQEIPNWKIISGKPLKIEGTDVNARGLGLLHLQESIASYLFLVQTYFEAAGKKEPPEFGFKIAKFCADVFRHGQAADERAREIPSRREYLLNARSAIPPEVARRLKRPQDIGRAQTLELLLAAMSRADAACAGYFSDLRGRRPPIPSPDLGRWRDLNQFKDPDPAFWKSHLKTFADLSPTGNVGFFMDSLFRWFLVLDKPPDLAALRRLADQMDFCHLHEEVFASPGWALTYNILQGLIYSPFLDSPFLSSSLGPPGNTHTVWVFKHGLTHKIWDKHYRLQWNMDFGRIFSPDIEELNALTRQVAAAFSLYDRVFALDESPGRNVYRIFYLLSRSLSLNLHSDGAAPSDSQDMSDLLERYQARFPESRSRIESLAAQWLDRDEKDVDAEQPEKIFLLYQAWRQGAREKPMQRP